MQASKVDLKKTYAVRLDGKLVRFSPTSVVTTRFRATGSPHDFRSHVTGYYNRTDVPWAEEQTESEAVQLKPEQLEGEYEQYTELVARKEAEDAERERIEQAKQDKSRRLQALLYDFTGLTKPPQREHKTFGGKIEMREAHEQPFRRYDHDHDVKIEASYGGVDALINALEATLAARKELEELV